MSLCFSPLSLAQVCLPSPMSPAPGAAPAGTVAACPPSSPCALAPAKRREGDRCRAPADSLTTGSPAGYIVSSLHRPPPRFHLPVRALKLRMSRRDVEPGGDDAMRRDA